MSKNLIDNYTGGDVEFPLVAAALDFIVSIQPSAEDPDGGEKYEAAQAEHASTLKKIEQILRAFGAAIGRRGAEGAEPFAPGKEERGFARVEVQQDLARADGGDRRLHGT